jgi:hypothetical protein
MNRYKKIGLGLLIVISPVLTILSATISGIGANHAHAQTPQPVTSECLDFKDNIIEANDCSTGVVDERDGKTKTESCGSFTDNSLAKAKTACEKGWDNAKAEDDNSCEAKNNTGVEWLVCGVLRAIDDTVNKINNEIEDQLNYKVAQNLSPQVYQAWSIFRILASVILVIIMLVMILAQATGGGPFEAYTIRKLLPRLVIAIILIQVSWWMFRYLVVVVNDLGKGIGDILAAPFGGQDKLSFDNLVGSLGGAGFAVTGAGAFLSGVALILNPVGALLLAFFVILGVIIALGVLLFRQALITACIIFAPIALVLWILPGTSRYWKLWWENFSKALFLFPIIASMIVIGHIFAWIVASSGGTVGPLDVFAVVLGFFGPFYLLPKAFSWGGTAMKIASNNIDKGITKAASPVKGTLDDMKGRSRWAQGRAARKAELDRRAKIGFAEGLGGTGVGGSVNRARLGGIGRPRNERAIREAISRRGRQQAEAEEIKAAQEVLQFEMSQAQDHDAFLRDVASGNNAGSWTDVYGNSHRIDERGQRTEWERVAALGELARLGSRTNMQAISDAGSAAAAAGGREQELFKKFLDMNSDKMLGPMKHLYYGTQDVPGMPNPQTRINTHSTIEGIKPAGVAAMDGAEMETLLGELTNRINTLPAGSAGHTEAVADLATLTSTYYQAATNESIRPNIALGVSKAMKAFVDGTNLHAGVGGVNRNRTGPGSPPIVDRAYDPATGATTGLGTDLIHSDPTLATVLGHLHTHIDNSGNVSV